MCAGVSVCVSVCACMHVCVHVCVGGEGCVCVHGGGWVGRVCVHVCVCVSVWGVGGEGGVGVCVHMCVCEWVGCGVCVWGGGG